MHVSKHLQFVLVTYTRVVCREHLVTQRATRTSAVAFPALMAVLTYSANGACTTAQTELAEHGLITHSKGLACLLWCLWH